MVPVFLSSCISIIFLRAPAAASSGGIFSGSFSKMISCRFSRLAILSLKVLLWSIAFIFWVVSLCWSDIPKNFPARSPMGDIGFEDTGSRTVSEV